MIEVKFSFPDVDALVAFLTRHSTANTPISPVTPEMQQAARDSATKGTAAPKPAKEPKAEKAPSPAPEADPPKELTAEDIAKLYMASGIPELIAKAQVKDKEATKAALVDNGAQGADGKVKGSNLKPDAFPAVKAALEKVLAEETME